MGARLLRSKAERGRTRRVNALYTSKQAMPPIHAQAGIGSTKKSRNLAWGAAKAKKDARAYIAPERCNMKKNSRSLARRLTARAMRIIVAFFVPR